MRILIALSLLLATNVFAAQYPKPDANGYVSQHDQPVMLSTDTCASGRTCHPLPTSCDVVFTPSTSLSSINNALAGGSGKHVFCFAPGTYSAFSGAVDLAANSDCTATSPCWVVSQYNVNKQTLTDPWRVSSSNVVTLKSDWACNGTHWIVSYLTWQGFLTSSGKALSLNSGCSGAVLNSLLETGMRGAGSYSFVNFNNSSSSNTVQRLYCHDNPVATNTENDCVRIYDSSNDSVVDSELANTSKGIFCFGLDSSATATCAGLTVENTDIYQTTSFTTDCSGNKSGDRCGWMKIPADDKSGGVSGNPYTFVHNRVWHQRRTDRSTCCLSTSDGPSFQMEDDGPTRSDLSPATYDLVQDNIFEDNERGYMDVRAGGAHTSIIGNIFYHIHDYTGDGLSYAITMTSGAMDSEVYLNSVIASSESVDQSKSNNDYRCNAFIATGNDGVFSGSNSEADYNTFYGTPEFVTQSPDHDVNHSSMTKWVADKSYAVGAVVIPDTSLVFGSNEATVGFVYEATSVTDKSGTTEPAWCTSLDCTVVDNGVTWRAIRAPMSYERKLLSGPQRATIPYARVSHVAPEVGTCPGRGSTNALGSRKGIGVDDSY